MLQSEPKSGYHPESPLKFWLLACSARILRIGILAVSYLFTQSSDGTRAQMWRLILGCDREFCYIPYYLDFKEIAYVKT